MYYEHHVADIIICEIRLFKIIFFTLYVYHDNALFKHPFLGVIHEMFKTAIDFSAQFTCSLSEERNTK
jgi:hypothetical protein